MTALVEFGPLADVLYPDFTRNHKPALVPVQDPGDEAMALMYVKTAMKSLPPGHPALKHLVGAALSLPSPEPTLGGAA